MTYGTLQENNKTESMQLHLAILGPRKKYNLVAKNHENNKVLNVWLTQQEVISWVKQKNVEGYTCWISLNDKDEGNDSIKGVCALCNFWNDIDANRSDKKVIATQKELQTSLDSAVKFQKYVEKNYGAYGFIAFSGNGFHVHFPVPRFELVGESFREEINEKVRVFAKQVAAKAGVKVDHTYDVRRVTTVIGSLNLKIPGQPLQTRWSKNVFVDGIKKAINQVDVARKQNKVLLEEILNTVISKPAVAAQTVKEHTKFDDLCKRDPKLLRLYTGDWKQDHKSRSEAEFALLKKLIIYGFSDPEIYGTMNKSQIGKWNEKRQGYREISLKKARDWVAEKNIPVNTQQNEKKKSCRSQADELILLCMDQEPDLFYNQYETPYARIKQNNALVIVPLRSRKFKVWLASLMWKSTQKAPGEKALLSAINVLQAQAQEGPRYTLFNRVAPAEDGIWIDMTDEKWRAIKITAEGWKIVDNPPIIFKRHSHQMPMVEPIKGGDYKEFFSFINIGEKDEETKLMIVCIIISYFIPEIPHPIIILYGIHGSAKSFVLKVIRNLIDPTSADLLSIPRDLNELNQQLSHHWCAFYDNISYLPAWVSDALCRGCTGGGYTKRKLYTDDEDVTDYIRSCIGLNGINVAARKADLLDRSLLTGLEEIKEEDRKEEIALLAEFEQQKPQILGGFLDLLVKTMKLRPTTNPKRLFRLADFTRWGCATAKALEKKEEDFIKAYENKIRKQIEEAVEAHPVGSVLIDFMDPREEWEGHPSELFREFNAHAKEMEVSTRQKIWPKAPHSLTRVLNELRPDLKAIGFEVITGLRTPEDNKRQTKIINNNSKSEVFEDTDEGKIRKKIYECLKKHKDYTFVDLQDYVIKNTPLNINQATDLLHTLINKEEKIGLSKTGFLGWVRKC